jgi:predicted alpha/beta-fold hydrolase
MAAFKPLFSNSHLQTIAGHYWRRPRGLERFPVERHFIATEPDVQVLVESQRPPGEAAGEIVMVHGLEGSGNAVYIRSLSLAALSAGFATHRFHMRTCGGTEHLCKTLYHAGLTTDLLAVLRQLQGEGRAPAYLVGFSLGGNVALKLAGELRESAWPILRGVCAVSTPLDLAACSDRMAEASNWIYQRRFVRRMLPRLLATGRYTRRDLAGLHTVRAIDDRITAPSFGFGDAANYYRSQSAIRFLPGIRIPTLLIQAKDDTFIPFEVFEREEVRSHPSIELRVTRHGGHLGFLARGKDRFWLDGTVMNWIREQNAKNSPMFASQF